MRSKYILIIFIVISALFNSCRKAKKNMEDYFPKVKVTSVVIQDDGSVLVSGEIESEGGSYIEHIGFCCDTKNKPKIEARQINVKEFDNTFSAVYENLSGDSTYYICAWAANRYGYTVGNSVELTGIKPAPPPCTFTLNSLDIGTGWGFEPNFNMYPASSQAPGEWKLIGGSSMTNVTIKFAGTIKTGIYVTNTNYNVTGNDVFFTFNTTNTLNYGSNVYVYKLSSGKFDITICNATWNAGSNTYTLNTRFLVTP